jgi:GT2 family glycosyltransferase
MIDALDAKPQAGIISCRLHLPGGELQHSCKRFPTIGNALATYCSLHFLNRKYLMASFDHSTEKEIDQPDATCILIRHSAIQDYIFDERYSILYNDVDLCQRIKRQGWTIIFIPSARIIHHGSQSTQQASPNVRLVMYQNVLLYYQTYFGFTARVLLTPILVLRYCIAARSMRGVSLFYSLSKASLA